MAAGMHEAGTLGRKAEVDGQASGFERFGDAHAVDFKAKDGEGTGAARVDRGGCARPSVERSEKRFGHARLKCAPLRGLDLGGIASHHGLGLDEIRPRHDLAAHGLQSRDHGPGRLELGPAFFGTPVQAPAAVGEEGKVVRDVGKVAGEAGVGHVGSCWGLRVHRGYAIFERQGHQSDADEQNGTGPLGRSRCGL